MTGGPGQGTDATGPVTALIVAAGSGQRLGADVPKALVPVGGRPMYEWSLAACLAASRIDRVVIAVPPGSAADFGDPEAELVDGGDSRSQSVAAGLELVTGDLVLVHDAARPLVTPELIDSAIDALIADPASDAVIAAASVTDTIKRVGQAGEVIETLDRSELRSVQTPQVFRTGALRRAIATGDVENATDDAFLIESAGGRVTVLTAPATNIKVTVPSDIELATLLLGAAAGMNPC
ncbi:MAG: 2-C-methyl-D-erythritol 4-phosphate cytidylyltransferase [Thermoleophilia bacterium]|nr:2-C-methyl-D-erythritol 4-phosphate cytidylyltransferase [Thermoleophilia bacterium]